MRLGGPIFETYSNPQHWIMALRRYGYSAAYCPVTSDANDSTIQAYVDAAESVDVIISEVGVWNNPLSTDEESRRTAIRQCQEHLLLADKIGARCCVNIAGSRGQQWDGPHPDNFTEDTFDLIVETVQEIIDAVKPTVTFYTLETMPWIYPDSPDNYLALIKDINRKEFAVHFDPANLISSPQRYYGNGAIIREFCSKLGPYIKSCHAKDVILREKFTVHIDEIRPGLGGLDFGTLITELSKLNPDTPLMVEHLSNVDEYSLASGYIRSVARKMQIVIR